MNYKSNLAITVDIPGLPPIGRNFTEGTDERPIIKERADFLEQHAAKTFKELLDLHLPTGDIAIDFVGTLAQVSGPASSKPIGTIKTNHHGLAVVHQHVNHADLALGAQDYLKRVTK